MKHSKLLSVLALIAFASLLSAANSGNPSDAAQGNPARTRAEKEHATGRTIMASAEQPNPNGTADHRQLETYNYYGNFNYIPQTTSTGEGFWAKHTTAIAGLSTIFVAIFTGALVVTSWLQWKAIGSQASIAERVLLFAERPYLDVQILEVNWGQRVFRQTIISSCLWIKYRFENSGRTPAFLTETNAIIAITDSEIPPSEPPYKPSPWATTRATIGASHWHESETWITVESKIELITGKKFAHFFVFVRYEDHLAENPRPHRTQLSGLVTHDDIHGFHLTFPASHTYVENT